MKVYLLVNNEEKYKIGYTDRDVNIRIKELQTGSHAEIHELYEYESTYAKQIETILHRMLSFNRIKGEWFNLTGEQVFGFLSLCKKIDDGLKCVNENMMESIQTFENFDHNDPNKKIIEKIQISSYTTKSDFFAKLSKKEKDFIKKSIGKEFTDFSKDVSGKNYIIQTGDPDLKEIEVPIKLIYEIIKK